MSLSLQLENLDNLTILEARLTARKDLLTLKYGNDKPKRAV